MQALSNIIFRRVTLFDGEQLVGERDVEVSGGAVTLITEPRGDDHYETKETEAMGRVLKVTNIGDAVVVDGNGLVLSPGFTDLHCHLRDPGYTWKEDIESGTRSAATGGFTTIVPMPNTDPPVDAGHVADYIHDRALRLGSCRVNTSGCLTLGRKGEALADLASLYAAGVRIFSDDGSDTLRPDTFVHSFEFLSMLQGCRAIIHAEVEELAQGVMHLGKVSSLIGHSGIHRLSEDLGVARAVLTSLETCQPVQATHISTHGILDLVRFGKAQAEKRGLHGLITADTTFHYLLLTAGAVAEYGTLAKINPPLREEEDRLALLEAVADGTIDALVTDHAPHTVDEKEQEMDFAPFGCVGFEIAFGLLNKHVVGTETPAGTITLERILKLMTSRPADILSGRYYQPEQDAIPKLGTDPLQDFHPRTIDISPGRITTGGVADLVLIDPRAEWTIDPGKFTGKGRNTPFAGWPAMGQIKATFVGGLLAYSAADTGIGAGQE